MNKLNTTKTLLEVDQSQFPIYTLPLINEPAPPFTADSTQGIIKFPQDYKGKWVLLFSYPGDFCATCTSEVISLAENAELYKDLGVELVGVSVDSIFSHVDWLESIDKITEGKYTEFLNEKPLVSDADREIGKKYGLIRRGQKDTETLRGMFLVDPTGKIKAIDVYPREVGRGGDEIRRMVAAVIKTTNEDVFTPANWQPGDDVLLPKARDLKTANEKLENTDPEGDVYCADWYYCYAKDTDLNAEQNNNNSNNNSNAQKTNSPYVKPLNPFKL